MLVTKSSVHLCLEGCDIFISVWKCKHSLKSITYFPIMPVNNAPVKQSAPTKATQSNVLVLMVRAYSIKDISYLLSSAVKINKNDCVDVFSGWSCLTCSVWKPVCTKVTVQELPLLVGDRRLWLSWTQALCRADVVTDEFLCWQVVESWDLENWPRRITMEVATKIDLEECWGKSIGDLWRWYH